MVDKKGLLIYIVHTMNHKTPSEVDPPPDYRVRQLQGLINEVQRCCEDRRGFEAQRLGVPYTELKCLMLFRNERYLTAKGIAHRLDVAKSRATTLVNSMCEKNLIDRTDDPKDARVKLLSLTPRGRKVADSAHAFSLELHGRILMQMEPEEQRRVLSGLELLRSAMESIRKREG